MVKEWNKTLKLAQHQYDNSNKSDDDKEALLEVARTCSMVRQEARKDGWQGYLMNASKSKNLADVWRNVNRVRGKKETFVAAVDPQQTANELADKWATAASTSSLPAETQAIINQLRPQRNNIVHEQKNITSNSCVNITKDELLSAIKRGNSTAPGADGITYTILNCLASMEKSPLLDLFNLSFRKGVLPKKWKEAIIIPIPKGNGSFRPISLTSCMCKMMERVILNRLLFLLGNNLSHNLYGFRKGKGAADCIMKCLSYENSLCRVFIDLEGAFDKASGEIITYQLANLGITGQMLCWISDYLCNRKAQVWYQGYISDQKILENGTPQGGVLSPTLFNVLMNRIASAWYPPTVQPVIYADDILLQGKNIDNMQTALDQLGAKCQSLGLVINENKTKFQCRHGNNCELEINGKEIERVSDYKYLGVYVGYSGRGKDAETRHVLAACKARLNPLKCLAWSGKGIGINILRMVYISTIRSLIDYAAPVLSVVGKGRMKKLEVIQNEAMRIILGCQKNTMTEIMRMELNLQSVCDRVQEINLKNLICLIRNGEGEQIMKYVNSERRSKIDYVKNVAMLIEKYEVKDQCMVVQVENLSHPPWENKPANVNITPLAMKKSQYVPIELKIMYNQIIENQQKQNSVHVFCDGSVSDAGRAGCGALIREYNEAGHLSEYQYGLRLSNHISSTHAELQAIKLGISKALPLNKDMYVFVDSQPALQSINCDHASYSNIVTVINNMLNHAKNVGISITFYWIPSHIGIRNNERVDEIAKTVTGKDQVDLHCEMSIKQLRSMIREKQKNDVNEIRAVMYENSNTFKHFIHVYQDTGYVYGYYGSVHVDTVIMRCRLGYAYYWELGYRVKEEDRKCRICKEVNAHTLTHYILQCPKIAEYRNSDIRDVTQQVIWLINNNKIPAILSKYKDFAPRI